MERTSLDRCRRPVADRSPRRWRRVVERNRAAANAVIAAGLEIVEQQRRRLRGGLAQPRPAEAVAVDLPVAPAAAVEVTMVPVATDALGQLLDPGAKAGPRLGGQRRQPQTSGQAAMIGPSRRICQYSPIGGAAPDASAQSLASLPIRRNRQSWPGAPSIGVCRGAGEPDATLPALGRCPRT